MIAKVQIEHAGAVSERSKQHAPSWLHRASNNAENLSLPTDAHNVKKHKAIKTF